MSLLAPIVFSLALSALLLAAASFDVTQFRIPNFIPVMVASLFLLKVGVGIETGPLVPHILVFTCMFALGFIAFTAGLLGGGDVKLMSALALWFGASGFADFITITAIAGGFLGVLLLLVRRAVPAALVSPSTDISSSSFTNRMLSPAAPLPYAVPISFAALWLEWF